MNANGAPPTAGSSTATVGLIVPPADGQVPADGLRLYPDLEFHTRGLGLRELSIDGYDEVIDAVADRGRQLVAEGADAVMLLGTSLSFYRGTDFNDELTASLSAACGVPVATLSTAVEVALHTVDATRVAVATAYDESVSATLHDYLAAKGFEVAGTAVMGITSLDGALTASTTAIADVAERAVTASGSTTPDALLISCGGLDTLDLLAPLEAHLGIPVIASSPTGHWYAATLVGHDPRVPGWGTLLEKTPERGTE